VCVCVCVCVCVQSNSTHAYMGTYTQHFYSIFETEIEKGTKRERARTNTHSCGGIARYSGTHKQSFLPFVFFLPSFRLFFPFVFSPASEKGRVQPARCIFGCKAGDVRGSTLPALNAPVEAHSPQRKHTPPTPRSPAQHRSEKGRRGEYAERAVFFAPPGESARARSASDRHAQAGSMGCNTGKRGQATRKHRTH